MAAEFRDYAEIDRVLYALASESENAHDLAGARAAYQQLLDDAPLSRFAPHARVALADLLFAEAEGDPTRWPLARRAYEAVLAAPGLGERHRGYALYRLGHVHWGIGGPEGMKRALDALARAVSSSLGGAAGEDLSDLHASARRDLLLLYARAGKPGEAHAFFKPLVGSAGAFAMMRELGEIHLERGLNAEASALYGELLRRDRGDDGCFYQARRAQAAVALKRADRGAVRAELESLARRAVAFKSEAHSAQAKLQCSSATVELLYRVASGWQIEAQGSGGVRGTGDKEVMALSLGIYERLLRGFTAQELREVEFRGLPREDWPTLRQLRTAAAELYFGLGRWADCGAAYTALVDEAPGHEEAAEAAFNAGVCYLQAFAESHAGGATCRRRRPARAC